MRESPTKGIIFWVVVILTIWAVYWNIGSILLTMIAAILLLGSLTSFFLPTTYTIDKSGASLKRWLFNRNIGWDRVRSVSDERGGLFLSPFPMKSRLENFRGLFLPYRDNREEVIAQVRNYVPAAGGLPEIEVKEPESEAQNIDR